MKQRVIAFVAVLLLVGCTGEPQTIVSELNGKTMGTYLVCKDRTP